MRSTSSTRHSRFGKSIRAVAIAAIGSVPAVLIASSARAANTTAADEWTIGLLALAFGSMLIVLTLLGSRMTQGLRASLRQRDTNDRQM